MYDDVIGIGGLRKAVVVRMLVIATLAVFAVQFVAQRLWGDAFIALFGLSRYGLAHGAIWQLGTYLFLHGGFWHIFLNMFGLVMFGREMEDVLGSRRFALLYFGCGLIAALGWVAISGALCIGASGAVYGVLGAFAALFPRRQVMLLFPPVIMQVRTMVIVFALISLGMMFTTDSNIAHAAHLAGGLAGYLYGRRWVKRGGWLGIGTRSEGGLGGLLAGLRARWRRGRLRMVSSEAEAPSADEVDRLLDKIKAQGIGSLTARERDALERASRFRRD